MLRYRQTIHALEPTKCPTPEANSRGRERYLPGPDFDVREPKAIKQSPGTPIQPQAMLFTPQPDLPKRVVRPLWTSYSNTGTIHTTDAGRQPDQLLTSPPATSNVENEDDKPSAKLELVLAIHRRETPRPKRHDVFVYSSVKMRNSSLPQDGHHI